MNVHIFDSQYKNHLVKTLYSKELKTQHFRKILEKMNLYHCNTQSINGIQLILNSIQSPANFDHSNNIYSDDLLIEICLILEEMLNNKNFKIPQITTELGKFKEEDFYKMLEEQMYDMFATGQCPQGRSTRLKQLYEYMIELKKLYETPRLLILNHVKEQKILDLIYEFL